MNNFLEKYFPIGTIVQVNNSELNFIIVGYNVTVDGKEKYDYMAYPYPQGFIANDANVVFNYNEISKIVFEGYKDEKYDKMIKSRLNINNEI